MRIGLVEGVGYVLDPEPLSLAELKRKPAYKIGMARYVSGTLDDGRIVLKDKASADGAASMIDRMQKYAERMGLSIEVDGEVTGEIERKREFARERSRAGVEIKAGDPKYEVRFAQYRQIVDDSFDRPLRPRQMRDSFFMCAMGKSGNFSVPGSGKTASVLGVFAYLAARGLASRVVVLCPKNAFESWRKEFVACFGKKRELIEFNVQQPGFSSLDRRERKRRMRLDTGPCNLILVNYEAAPTYVDELKDLVRDSSLLVLDEVHRVKRVGGKLASAAIEIASVSGRTIALTGTPIPNSYLDIYNFLHILFPREYDAFFGFSTAMLSNPGSSGTEAINARIQPFFCRTTKDDLGVPPANEDVIERINVSAETERVFDVLKMRYRKNKLALMLRVLQLETDPLLLLQDLDTAEYAWLLSEDDETGEIDYVDFSDEVVDMIRSAPRSEKMSRCLDLVSAYADSEKPVIVWCVFVRTMLMMAERLVDLGLRVGIVYGDTPQQERERILESFRAGELDVLITNPHTLGESVSLHSVCHDAIYYEYSFNLVHLLQSKDRIHRLGLPDGQYTQYVFLQDVYGNYNDGYSLDEKIYRRLREKERTMLDAIADRRLEVMPTTEEDLDAIFEGLFDD